MLAIGVLVGAFLDVPFPRFPPGEELRSVLARPRLGCLHTMVSRTDVLCLAEGADLLSGGNAPPGRSCNVGEDRKQAGRKQVSKLVRCLVVSL